MTLHLLAELRNSDRTTGLGTEELMPTLLTSLEEVSDAIEHSLLTRHQMTIELRVEYTCTDAAKDACMNNALQRVQHMLYEGVIEELAAIRAALFAHDIQGAARIVDGIQRDIGSVRA